MKHINEHYLKRRIQDWLYEDMPFGDITSENVIPVSRNGEVSLIAKEDGFICGLPLADYIFKACDETVHTDFQIREGSPVKAGQVIGGIKGPIQAILQGERLFLNLLQRLSGIATMSMKYSQAVSGLETRIVDTRKTTPGLRDLEKYAVKIGGCHNHRFSLSDAVMLKDNHIKAAGSIGQGVKQVRDRIPHTMKIEVETENLLMVRQSLEAGADIIMLDNMSTRMMSEAVDLIRNVDDRVLIEASGNMVLSRVREVAETGVDIISVGALTHSVVALDISMKYL